MKGSVRLGTVCAVSAAVIWGFLGVAVRNLEDAGFSSAQMTCLRYIVVAVIMIAFVLICDRSLLRISREALGILLVMGIFGTLVNSTMYFESMQRITLSLSTVLQYISPFVVVILSVPLFHERITAVKLIALALAFLGCILCTGVLTDPGDMDLLGIALGTGSGFCYAMYTLGSKEMATRGYHTATILLYTSVFCAVLLLPFADVPEMMNLLSSWNNVLMVLAIGVLLTLLPFGLYNIAVRNMEAGRAAIITFIEPIAATAVGFAVYNEEVGLGTVAGLLLVLIALILVNRPDNNVPDGRSSADFSDPAGPDGPAKP